MPLAQVEEEDVGVGLEVMLRGVPVMHVPVNDGDALEAVSNAETGFFRPIPRADGSLIVFEYTGLTSALPTSWGRLNSSPMLNIRKTTPNSAR